MPTDTKRAGGEDQADAPVEKRQKIDPIESEHVEVKVKGKSKGSFLCASKKAWTEAEVCACRTVDNGVFRMHRVSG